MAEKKNWKQKKTSINPLCFFYTCSAWMGTGNSGKNVLGNTAVTRKCFVWRKMSLAPFQNELNRCNHYYIILLNAVTNPYSGSPVWDNQPSTLWCPRTTESGRLDKIQQVHTKYSLGPNSTSDYPHAWIIHFELWETKESARTHV